MSPELIEMTSNFFRALADIAPTLIITGNHDCNLNNSNRLDALSPIVTALKHTDIHYLKDNGVLTKIKIFDIFYYNNNKCSQYNNNKCSQYLYSFNYLNCYGGAFSKWARNEDLFKIKN